MSKEVVSINIWDDYYDDGFVPTGEIQETYAYVECDLSEEQSKEVLTMIKEQIEAFQLTHSKLKFEMNLHYYESSKVYPNLVGTEYEYILYNRWQLQMKHLTHEWREELVDELNQLNLQYNNIPVEIYSES